MNIKNGFWKKWINANELDRIKIIGELPLMVEIKDKIERHSRVSILNSYLVDLYEYLEAKK